MMTFPWTIVANIGRCVTIYKARQSIVKLLIADDPSICNTIAAIKKYCMPDDIELATDWIDFAALLFIIYFGILF